MAESNFVRIAEDKLNLFTMISSRDDIINKLWKELDLNLLNVVENIEAKKFPSLMKFSQHKQPLIGDEKAVTVDLKASLLSAQSFHILWFNDFDFIAEYVDNAENIPPLFKFEL